jgi:hypothetical protein
LIFQRQRRSVTLKGMRAFLIGFWGLGVGVLFAAACGGNVTFEPAGSGGGGATTATNTTSSTTTNGTGGSTSSNPPSTTSGIPSTSSGPMPVCDCPTACTDLESCFGIPFGDCLEACERGQLPPRVQSCACQNRDCGAIEACLSGSGGAGGGPGLTPECESCTNDVAETQCDSQIDQCTANPNCVALIDCHVGCDWEPGCTDACNQMIPGGQFLFTQVVQCVVCGQCFEPCETSSIIQYCFIDG